MKKEAFTLVELMVVVAIIAILVVITVPRFGIQLAKSQDAKALEIVASWRSGFALHLSEEQSYPSDFGKIAKYVDVGTMGKTYEDNTGSVVVTLSSTVDKAWVRAGNPIYVQFQVVTSSGLEEISFVSGQVATDSKDWSTK